MGHGASISKRLKAGSDDAQGASGKAYQRTGSGPRCQHGTHLRQPYRSPSLLHIIKHRLGWLRVALQLLLQAEAHEPLPTIRLFSQPP